MYAKKNIANKLIRWYEKNGRKFPWRYEQAPYKIMIAEIMLQRTKAEQVVPVYLSFINEFPNPSKLYAASEEEIVKYFHKLGLFHRAELVKNLSGVLVQRFKGNIPENREDLLSLPAVGEYVASAILSFAFDKRVSIVDSNVCRVVSRVFGLKSRGEARRDPSLKRIVDQILPEKKVKEFNWAIIDLAAKICFPRKPLCDICPLKNLCAYAKSQN